MYERDRHERDDIYIEEDDDSGSGYLILGLIVGLLMATVSLAILTGWTSAQGSDLVNEEQRNNYQRPIQIDLRQVQRPANPNPSADSGDEIITVRNRGSDVRIDEEENDNIAINDSGRASRPNVEVTNNAEAESSSSSSSQVEWRRKIKRLLREGRTGSEHYDSTFNEELDEYSRKPNK